MRILTLLAVLLASTTPGLALEKSAAHLGAGDWEMRDWEGTVPTTCSISYYNICTGYIWIWSGWAANSVLGTVYDTSCCDSAENIGVNNSYFYYRTGAPADYGFTGTAALTMVDANDCPAATLASQPILPASGWNFLVWSLGFQAPKFAQVHTLADANGFGTPVTVATDGAGGACGVCFPTTRSTHSYTWGTTGSLLCPGFAMNDGACNVEWLSVATVFCSDATAVENGSWGEIKALYR